MRLKRTEVERRKAVALNFFKNNPTATAASFLKELTTGTLTGAPEKSMAMKAVYELRSAARTEVAK